MASIYDQSPQPEFYTPQSHPYLHEPLLYISHLPPYVTDQNLALAFMTCGPFRPKIPRDGSNMPLSGTIEFKFLDKGKRLLYRPHFLIHILMTGI